MSAAKTSTALAAASVWGMPHAELEPVLDDGGFPINCGPLQLRRPAHRSTRHEQMWIDRSAGTGTLVDVGIASTIIALWAAGVDTAFSCQGGAHAVRYVSVRAAHRFVAAAVVARMGETVVRHHGQDRRWVFQLSGSPLL